MTRILYDLADREECRFSPYCWRAKMALAHKGLDFEARAVPFTGIPGILDGSHKTVPVLDDDGQVVSDSFRIALYLERAYPDRPSLFGGPGGEGAARFLEQWTNMTVNAGAITMIVADIHDRLSSADQAYFRQSREARFGRRLEEVQAGRSDRLADLRKALAPARKTLEMQPFLGGEAPLFTDYILFGSLQWVRVSSPFALIEEGDPLGVWFERCLDLFDGLGRSMPAAQAAA